MDRGYPVGVAADSDAVESFSRNMPAPNDVNWAGSMTRPNKDLAYLDDIKESCAVVMERRSAEAAEAGAHVRRRAPSARAQRDQLIQRA